MISPSLLQVVNSLFQTCYSQLGTSTSTQAVPTQRQLTAIDGVLRFLRVYYIPCNMTFPIEVIKYSINLQKSAACGEKKGPRVV
jgi:hypothetical protein